MNRSRWCRLVASVVLGTGALVSGAAAPGEALAAPGITTYRGTTGVAPVVTAPLAKATHAPSTRPRGARVHALPSTTSRLAPTASESTATTAGRLLHNINGVSSLDSQVTNFNLTFEPPDQGLCAGNGFVIEAVNSAYSIYRTSGQRVRGPFNVNDLFNEGAAEFTSDPRCYFDAATHTWFAIILFLNSSFTASHLDVAVNSGDPTGLWTQYRFDTTDSSAVPGCPCFGDQPLIGIDQHNLYVAGDEFSINGPEFNGAEIHAISKADLIAGRAAHFAHFAHLRIGGDFAATLQPALSPGLPNAEFFMNALGENRASDNRLGVWAMTNRAAVDHGGTPTLSSTVVQSERYAQPPAGVQRGSTAIIASNDTRMQQTQFIGGTLWGELTTAVTIAGDSRQRAGAAWFAVRPTVHNGHIAGATVIRQGYVVKRGEYVLYPALQADTAGRAAMVFTLTSASRFPSAAYAVLGAGSSAFGPVAVAAAGTGPYVANIARWGDYSFASLDAGADAVWLATAYVPPLSSQTTTGQRNWGTRVFEVSLQ